MVGGEATVDFNGKATLNLTAPTSGTLAGVLIYQGRRSVNTNNVSKINGDAASKLQGAIYFPNQGVDFADINVQCNGKLLIFRVNAITFSAQRRGSPP